MAEAPESILRTWRYEHGTSATCIRAVPQGTAAFRPHGRSRSMGELCRHLGEAERFFVVGCLGVEVPGPDPVAKDAPLPDPGAVADAFDRSHAALAAAVEARAPAWFEEPVEFYGMRLPRADVLGVMVRHEVHHRGQLSVFLRLAGGKVPAIYGPSADAGA